MITLENEGCLKLDEIFVGQKVKLICPYLSTIFRDNSGILIGKVIDIFCIKDDVYQVEISNSTQRFRWQSNKDGGYLLPC